MVTEPPPKARLAAVGAVTLLLGLAAGILFGRATAPGTVVVSVPGARAVGATCGDLTSKTRGAELALPIGLARCTLRAEFEAGRIEETTVDAGRPGRYLCRPHQGGLRCTGP